MIVEVDGRKFGWGEDARDLPENSEAYGAKILTSEELVALGKAIRAQGWEPFWSTTASERVVFLVEPEKWRQSITARTMGGQTYQVREMKRGRSPRAS